MSFDHNFIIIECYYTFIVPLLLPVIIFKLASVKRHSIIESYVHTYVSCHVIHHAVEKGNMCALRKYFKEFLNDLCSCEVCLVTCLCPFSVSVLYIL